MIPFFAILVKRCLDVYTRSLFMSIVQRLSWDRFVLAYTPGGLRVFCSDGFPYVIAPAFSTPAFSTPAIYSCIFSLLHFPSLLFTPAFFHSCIFHSRIFSAPILTPKWHVPLVPKFPSVYESVRQIPQRHDTNLCPAPLIVILQMWNLCNSSHKNICF